MKSLRLIVLPLTLPVLLTACGDEHSDIKAWMAESSKGLTPKVKPLPQMNVVKPVEYEGIDLLDPFATSRIDPVKKNGGPGTGIQPDFNRRREPLESFPLESLKMVGTLRQMKLNYALIKADSNVHRVKIGNYMGQNFGIITNISDNEVKLKELVQDPSGEWVERESTLQLQQQDQQQETKK